MVCTGGQTPRQGKGGGCALHLGGAGRGGAWIPKKAEAASALDMTSTNWDSTTSTISTDGVLSVSSMRNVGVPSLKRRRAVGEHLSRCGGGHSEEQ